MEGISMVTVWIVLLAVFLIAEILTVGALVSIWFCFGSGAALICALAGGGVELQTVLFIGVSLILLLLTRPFIKRFIRPKESKTNADRIVGFRAVVLEEIDNLHGTGSIEVDGKIWTARSVMDNDILPAGSEVLVERIEGVKAMVRKYKL